MANMEPMMVAIEQYENTKMRSDRHFVQAAQAMKYCFREICGKALVPFSDEISIKVDEIIEEIKLGIMLEIKAEKILKDIPHSEKQEGGHADITNQEKVV